MRPVINMKTEDGVRKFEAIANEVADLVLEFGGALSGEHGDGLVRSPFMRQMFGDTLYEAFREIKRTFDPLGHFQSRQDCRCAAAHRQSALRRGLSDAAIRDTFFDYSEYGGLGGAVEMCSGVGACRKKLAGTMCPSYMATREESASTRGRANVLRLAMAGQLGEAGLGDEGVYRGSRSVPGMPRVQSGMPGGRGYGALQERISGRLLDASRHAAAGAGRWAISHKLSVWGSRFAPLSNWIVRTRRRAGSMRRCWTSTARRSCPRGSARRSRNGRQNIARARSGSTPVTLFNDTFTNHYDPEIGIAAVEVLERGGCAVNVVRPGCCGRPLISQGLLSEARAHARKSSSKHCFRSRQRGEKILFCEPSCLSAVKEDAPSLAARRAAGESPHGRRGVRAVRRIRRRTRSAAARRAAERSCCMGTAIRNRWACCRRPWRCSRRFPRRTVVDLDAGCCGMAGSFGYTQEHYDVSVAIANRRLLPAVKAMKPGDVLVAPGTSCRHQVQDLNGACGPASGGA